MMTDEERDALLRRLEGTVGRLERKVDRIDVFVSVFVRGMAHKLLSPAEVAELEAKVAESEAVAAN